MTFGPVAGAPIAALAFGITSTGPATSFTAETARIEPSVWLVEIATASTTVAVSDRGWIEDPGHGGGRRIPFDDEQFRSGARPMRTAVDEFRNRAISV